MSHDYHEGLDGYNSRSILHDGCAECEERSRNGLGGLLHLDEQNAARLWRVMIVAEREYGDRPASDCDARLVRELYRLAVFLERNTEIDPWAELFPADDDELPCLTCGDPCPHSQTRCDRCKRNLEEDRLNRELGR